MLLPHSAEADTILADHIPVKQGLRLFDIQIIPSILVLADHIPVKQGLRRMWSCARSTRVARSGSQTIFQ